MSFLDGAREFFDKLGFFGGDDELDEGEEDEEEAEEPEQDAETEESGGIFGRLRSSFGGGRATQDSAPERPRVRSQVAENPFGSETVTRGTIIRDERMMGRAVRASQEACRERIVDVRQIEQCRDIIKYLLAGETVIVNLENMDPKDCGRIVDLLSGAAYALQGRMLKAAHLCYLLAPQSVEIINERELRPSGPGRSV